jgi:hypothetical protein
LYWVASRGYLPDIRFAGGDVVDTGFPLSGLFSGEGFPSGLSLLLLLRAVAAIIYSLQGIIHRPATISAIASQKERLKG